MMLTGRIAKGRSRFWTVEVDAIAGHTQGDSKADATAMLIDLIRTMVDRRDLKVTVTDAGPDGAVLIESAEPWVLAGLVLRRQRELAGLSLADVAKKLGASSRNAYAAYEQGKREPSLSKFREFLAAVAPEMVMTVGPRKAGR